jgi:hypothetical protein
VWRWFLVPWVVELCIYRLTTLDAGPDSIIQLFKFIACCASKKFCEIQCIKWQLPRKGYLTNALLTQGTKEKKAHFVALLPKPTDDKPMNLLVKIHGAKSSKNIEEFFMFLSRQRNRGKAAGKHTFEKS